MKKFSCIVTETRMVKVRYLVEAENTDEAIDKVYSGDTTQENDFGSDGILDRCPWDSTLTEVV